MKKLILGLLFAGSINTCAEAQTVNLPEQHLSPIDCSVLSGTPYVCVRNARKVSVTGISCSGFWGTKMLSLPGGSIASGGTAIVNFDSGKCSNAIKVNTRDGQPFEINGFDTHTNTVLNISDR